MECSPPHRQRRPLDTDLSKGGGAAVLDDLGAVEDTEYFIQIRYQFVEWVYALD